MSGGEDDLTASGNRTVFRPSPLAGLQTQQPAAPIASPSAAPPAAASAPPSETPSAAGQGATTTPPTAAPPVAAVAPITATVAAPPPRPTGPRLTDEGFPVPTTPRESRAPMVTEAGPVLALAASIRSGRARIAMADFQRAASDALLTYDRAITPLYPDETRRTARALLAATVDDIATNLPNLDGAAPWSGASLTSEFGADRDEDAIWKEVENALKEPEDNADIIELAHACIAAGYQGKFRTAENGRAGLSDLTTRIYAGIDHIKALSMRFVSPQWVGYDAPLGKVGVGNVIALAGAGALVLVLAVYALLRVMGGGA